MDQILPLQVGRILPLQMDERLTVEQDTFLQELLNRGPLRQDLLLHMYQSLWKTSSLVGFNSFLGAINRKLESVDMEVTRGTDQNDGKAYFAIINKRSSLYSKLGTKYSLAQLGYFKAVIEAIALESSGTGYINSFKALSLKPRRFQQVELDPSQPSTSQLEFQAPLKMTLQAKGEALGLLVEDQWLNRNEEGEVTLGTRAYLELQGMFRKLVKLSFCEVCNEAAITADLCENPDCPVRMHSYCAVKKFRGRKARVCSDCKTRWSCGASGSTSNSSKRKMEEEIEEARVGRRTRRTCYMGNPSEKNRRYMGTISYWGNGQSRQNDDGSEAYRRSRALDRALKAKVSNC